MSRGRGSTITYLLGWVSLCSHLHYLVGFGDWCAFLNGGYAYHLIGLLYLLVALTQLWWILLSNSNQMVISGFSRTIGVGFISGLAFEVDILALLEVWKWWWCSWTFLWGGFSDCCFLDVTDLERTVVIWALVASEVNLSGDVSHSLLFHLEKSGNQTGSW